MTESDPLAAYVVDAVLGEHEFARADGTIVTIPLDPGAPYRATPVNELGATVTRLVWESAGSELPMHELAAVTTTLAAIASAAPARRVALRAAETRDGVVLDLADRDEVRGAIHVTASGWERVDPREVAILFGSTCATEALPIPTREGSRDMLAELLGLSPSSVEFRQVWAWLVCALFASMPRPLLTVTGPQGAGKSTLARMVKSVIDPALGRTGREGGLGPAPTDDEATNTTTAESHFVPAWDNVARVSGDTADWLASLVTGATTIRQAAAGPSVLTLRRAGIITAQATPGGLAADVTERLVTVDLDRIPASARRTERALWDEFHAQHAAILGALLDDVAGVLANLDRVSSTGVELSRLADYHEHLVALDLHHGTDPHQPESYAATYAASVAADELTAEDAFPVAVANLAAGGWEGTATELRDALAPARPTRAGAVWPSGPSQTSAELSRHAEALRALGVTVRRTTRDGGRRRLYVLDRNLTAMPTP
ncbi:hypothetical protein LG299_02685 [Microbacterium lacus]|uniref:hypothetical protein n=1 Tax=Microbacterium lacus TaxID=415217 RepID=UPI00384AD25E